jgi:hypothetical protein
METQDTECEGCNDVKTVPMITIEEDSLVFPGLCEECVARYGMQTGQALRLQTPDHNGETEVLFLQPETDAVRVRHSDGLTSAVGWRDFEKITMPQHGRSAEGEARLPRRA